MDLKPFVPKPRRPALTYTVWKRPNETWPLGEIVYFIYCAGRIKIGYSTDFWDRRNGIATSSPFPPMPILIVQGTRDVEAEFHVRFADDRRHGEWFEISQHLRNFLRRRLCPLGKASFAKAEAEFHAAIQPKESTEPYKRPKWPRPRKRCSYRKPWLPMCPMCVRDRDLTILEDLNRKQWPSQEQESAERGPVQVVGS